MSVYTTQVRFLCESLAGYAESQGFKKVNEIVEKAAPLIFDNFPIFDENHRLELEVKILKHYYTREISAETPGLWILWLNNKLNEIMPYYNQLYYISSLQFNPFHDVDLVRTHDGQDSKTFTQGKNLSENISTTGTVSSDQHNVENGNTNTDSKSSSTSEGSSTAKSKDSHDYDILRKYSDTPQGSISGDPIFENYLTKAEKEDGLDHTNGEASTTSNTTTTGSSDYKTDTTKKGEISSQSLSSQTSQQAQNETTNGHQDGTNDFTETIKGKQGSQSYSQLKLEYKKTIDNIDLMIINELTDLFFNLY